MLPGLYALAFLFEYAATLGLLDIAYITPEFARQDFQERFLHGLRCLSRYDGLLHVRINTLGAWCLGMMATYQAEASPPEPAWQIQLKVVVETMGPALTAAELLFLEQFADRKSALLWLLNLDKVQAAMTATESSFQELIDFLMKKSSTPPTPEVEGSPAEQKQCPSSAWEDVPRRTVQAGEGA